jgi:putative transposase
MLNELTEDPMTQEDVFGKDGLFRQLQKAVLEKMLNKELDFHLSSEKQLSGPGDYRNGKGHKRVKSESGEIPLDTPRDKDGAFERLIVPKRQRRIGVLDSAMRRKGPSFGASPV